MRRITATVVVLLAWVWFPEWPSRLAPSKPIFSRGPAVADAAPRKKRVQVPRSRKSKRPRPRIAIPTPVLPDDPSSPLRVSWERHLVEFLRQSGTTHGAFVALAPHSGEILALAEHSRNPKQVRRPATDSRFPAASVFKMVTAAALLETAGVRPQIQVCYHGGRSWLNSEHLKDSPKRDRSCRSLASSFALSTNAVFGKLAVKYLDSEKLLAIADRFGFNHRIQVGERETLSRARPARDVLDLGRMAAGFTNAWLSPLHGAVLGAIVANGGMWPSGVRLDGETRKEGSRVLTPETAASLRSMMELAATDGTGRRHLATIASRGGRGTVAVKTGTLTSRDGSGLFNTWMVGFYPSRDPEIAFAALISTQGGHAIKAGHLTRYALETYLRLKKARQGRS